MENIMSNKKLFSQIGLRLFFGTLIIYAVQILAIAIANNIPAIANVITLIFWILPMTTGRNIASHANGFPVPTLHQLWSSRKKWPTCMAKNSPAC